MNRHIIAGEIKSVIGKAGLSVKDAAKFLGVNRVTLSRLLNGHSELSIDMACRCQKIFNLNASDLLHKQLQIKISYYYDEKKENYKIGFEENAALYECECGNLLSMLEIKSYNLCINCKKCGSALFYIIETLDCLEKKRGKKIGLYKKTKFEKEERNE